MGAAARPHELEVDTSMLLHKYQHHLRSSNHHRIHQLLLMHNHVHRRLNFILCSLHRSHLEQRPRLSGTPMGNEGLHITFPGRQMEGVYAFVLCLHQTRLHARQRDIQSVQECQCHHSPALAAHRSGLRTRAPQHRAARFMTSPQRLPTAQPAKRPMRDGTPRLTSPAEHRHTSQAPAPLVASSPHLQRRNPAQRTQHTHATRPRPHPRISHLAPHKRKRAPARRRARLHVCSDVGARDISRRWEPGPSRALTCQRSFLRGLMRACKCDRPRQYMYTRSLCATCART